MADQIVIFSTKIGLGYKKYLGKQTNLYGIDRYLSEVDKPIAVSKKPRS